MTGLTRPLTYDEAYAGENGHASEMLEDMPADWERKVGEPSSNGDSSPGDLQEPVAENGAALLDDVFATVTNFVVWPNEVAAVAYTLWIAATHATQAWEHATRFVLKSPIKRCGKTRAQEIARELVHQPLSTTNISVAALVRSIDKANPPVLILDEADAIFGRKGKDSREGSEDLRGILNTGHARDWPYIRWDPSSRQRDECPTFAMALIGGIGDLPDTIEDRAVVVPMRRRAPGEPVGQFRRRRALPALHKLRDQLHAWVTAHLSELEVAEPDLPVEDRQADVWEPLIAVGDLAGGDWPDRARNACRELCAVSTVDDGTLGEQLLIDLRSVWKDDELHLFTTTILERLKKIDESPWDEGWGNPPKQLTSRRLAGLLKPYGVTSRNVRVGEVQAKGYDRAEVADLWHRYVQAVLTSQNGEAPSQDGDGNGTEGGSVSVPGVGQGKLTLGDGGTDGTDTRLQCVSLLPEPGDPDHGLKVAQARAEEVRRQRAEQGR